MNSGPFLTGDMKDELYSQYGDVEREQLRDAVAAELSPGDRMMLQQELLRLNKQLGDMQPQLEAMENRRKVLLSTTACGEVSGSNMFNIDQGKYPWMPFHEDIANYLDAPPALAKGIKMVAVARGHLKSEIGVHALCRAICSNPESRNCLLAATSFRAQANLANVAAILMSDEFQAAFPDRLYPPDCREAYTKTEITLRRKGKYREPTLWAMGLDSNAVGSHVGMRSKLWADDIVTDRNSTSPELRLAIMDAFEKFFASICDPGSETWMTFTRYWLDDAYSYFLDEKSDWSKYVEPGKIILGCFIDPTVPKEEREPLYPLRYCMGEDECWDEVEFRGKKYKLPRESLVQKESAMLTPNWNSQYMNDPQPDGSIIFDPSYFDDSHILPCNSCDIYGFLDDPDMVKQYIEKPAYCPDNASWLNRGILIPAISGDPSYGKEVWNDYQVIITILQDRFNNWYVCEGYYERKGYQGLEEYCRTAMDWRDDYDVYNPLGIEAHGKEALKTVSMMVAREEKREDIEFAKLTANSNEKKQIRYAATQPQFKNHNVYWCKNMIWLRDLAKDEMTTFGGGQKHDDIGDTFANFMDEEVLPPRDGATVYKAVDTSGGARRLRGMRRAG